MPKLTSKPGTVWPQVEFANGSLLDVQERVDVIALKDFQSQQPSRNGKYAHIKAGTKAQVRHWPPRTLTLVTRTSGNSNFRDVQANVEEGVDFVLK